MGHRERLRRAAGQAREAGVDVMLVTPSKDYAYLLGYAAPAMERLTCLVVPADGKATLVLRGTSARVEVSDRPGVYFAS